jgi:hypothetical protein
MKVLQIILTWIPFAVVITGLCFFTYVAVQQNYRQSANDPQIQIAQDTAAGLGENSDIQLNVNTQKDISKTLSPFLMVWNNDKKLLLSNAQVKGETPTVPDGVFDYTRKNKEDRFTWEPQKGVRIAAVMEYYTGKHTGFVLVGRSLKEVEIRENQLAVITMATWVTSLIVALFSVAGFYTLAQRRK